MARRKSGLGKVLVIGGGALLAYYGYKKGWFDPVKEWWAGLGDGAATPSGTTPGEETPADTTPSENGGGFWQGISDLISSIFGGDDGEDDGTSPLKDLLDKIDDFFEKRHDEKTNETVIEQAANALPAIIPALSGTAGAATGATVASGALTPAAANGAGSPAAVQGTTSQGAAQAAATASSFWNIPGTPTQLAQLARAPIGTQLAAVAMAAVPVFIGTSSAVAAGVHKANISITRGLQNLGIQKQTAAIQGEPSKQEKIAGFAITRMETKYGAANVAAAGITQASALAMMESTDDTNTLTSKLRTAYLAKK